MPHPSGGGKKKIHMHFGSDGFGATMNTCAGLKRRRSIEWLLFRNLSLKRNNPSGFSTSTAQDNRGVCTLWSCQCFLLCSNTESFHVQRCLLSTKPFTLVEGPHTSPGLSDFTRAKNSAALGTTATLPSYVALHCLCNPLKEADFSSEANPHQSLNFCCGTVRERRR